MHMGETGSSSVDKEKASVMASTAWLECKMGENVKVGFAGCATVQLAKWLRIKETV
ncbi:hypothetical protein PC118_g12677 [Phytophthora cactorum]|uniref:Uncharacterized protein n=1 Tax=Phytophthora cactorum TaxID=29920 RepID=A0A8T1FM96_9STRA|nr:hypothetical protein PC111_g11711 [Phytophthora cactorum]KAG2827308.1 hypothetical protein PC112_g8899 [Phytophthora cactorum]KAG2852753.1 hypothetical protein PC113_g14755 [Phytophthora cactorum]KAG2907396.1 hypothetical protein PC115_g13956 [Phytophthora cactorum]KAG2945511.1 hypothetical protein PC117_g8393 [Phytophthora cactorum]